ncbi:sideroflexin-4 isoform 3-T3 [Leptosomus discolor]
MDANLRFWRAEGQTFFQRFLLWADVLDPLLLLNSSDEIRRNRLFVQNSGKTLSEPIQNDQTRQAFLLSLVSLQSVSWGFFYFLTHVWQRWSDLPFFLFFFFPSKSSVHPDTDKIIPVLFRPPAFLPICLPLVVVTSLQLQAKQTFFGQFVFHMYTTGFTLFNGNGTAKAEEYSLQQRQVFYGLGAVSYAACIGALPLVFMNRYTLKSSFTQLAVRKLLPAPILGLMSGFTVAVVRSPEFENGIEVMDRNGKVVGMSQKAGEKKQHGQEQSCLGQRPSCQLCLCTLWKERNLQNLHVL